MNVTFDNRILHKGLVARNWDVRKRLLQVLVEFVRVLREPDDSKYYDRRNKEIFELWSTDRPTYRMKAQTLAENLKLKGSNMKVDDYGDDPYAGGEAGALRLGDGVRKSDDEIRAQKEAQLKKEQDLMLLTEQSGGARVSPPKQ